MLMEYDKFVANLVTLTGLPHEPTPVAFFSVVRREVTITRSMIDQNESPPRSSWSPGASAPTREFRRKNRPTLIGGTGSGTVGPRTWAMMQ